MTSIAYAMGGAGGQGSPGGDFGFILMMTTIFLIFYFLLIRPQQRKEKERRMLIESIKSGDKVIFGGGMIGIVTNIKNNIFTIKIADNTKVDVLRGSVTRVIQKDEDLGTASKE